MVSAPVFARPEFLEMRFTNRASCALDSKKPTSTAFLLINNMDVARSLYRLAKAKGEDTTTLTQNGIKAYRYSIQQLFQIINKRLANRELPLLVADSTKEGVPSRYRKIMQQCRSDDYCPELDDYLQSVWQISANKTPGKIFQLEKIDDFDPDIHFLNKKIFSKPEVNKKLSCSYLKKFSPLQAQLFGSKPTKEVLMKIGEAANHVGDYLADCDDFNQQENVKVASYELSLPGVDERSWNEQGFDYWNSMKIYFSWAFRNAPEMKSLAFPFHQIFSAVAIEDSTIIVPSGCKSMTPPKCESDYLNQNAIREFAKNDFKKEAINLDILSTVPEGAQKDLMSDPFSEVNRDILDFSQFKNSDAWLDNFRENFSAARSLMRKRLLLAVTNLDMISTRVNSSDLFESILKLYSPIGSALTPKEEINFLKNDLYYLCSEFSFAGNDELGFIKNKLDLLKKATLLDKVTGSVVDQSSEHYFDYFDSLSKKINQMCLSFDQKKIWDQTFELDKTGFSNWYIQKVYDDKWHSSMSQKQAFYLLNHDPLLAYSGYRASKNIHDMICENASGCARLLLKSIIDLYAASQYADTFWNLNNQMKSPSIFNPYAERTACKVYDPWFKTKSVMFGFFTDVAQAGLSIVSPGVIFAKFDLEPGRIVSFNQLVKEGKIQYDKKYDKQKISAGLAVDFGKLLGVPCGVSVSRSEKENPYNYLQFQGIGVRTCKENETRTIEVNSPTDITSTPGKKTSQCLVCSLNFESVSNIGGRTFPAMSSAFFLVRAMFRLYKGFTDHINIPRSWSVDPKLVQSTMKAFNGDIPKYCVYPLSHSRSCEPQLESTNF